MNEGRSKAEKKQDRREVDDRCWKFLQQLYTGARRC